MYFYGVIMKERSGWICPRCGACNAPFVEQCKCVLQDPYRDFVKKRENSGYIHPIWIVDERNTPYFGSVDPILGIKWT